MNIGASIPETPPSNSGVEEQNPYTFRENYMLRERILYTCTNVYLYKYVNLELSILLTDDTGLRSLLVYIEINPQL